MAAAPCKWNSKLGYFSFFSFLLRDRCEDDKLSHLPSVSRRLNGTKWASNLWVWSGPRPAFPNAPLLWPEEPKATPAFKEVKGEFRNTGKDPRFNERTEVFWSDTTFFGKLGPSDPPVNVNTYEGHEWNIKVDGEILKTFKVAGDKEHQVFEV